ncbi:anti-sigma factor domain-containing protein [Sporolactobacillus sp. THM19-2]|uniref:anti-sigma factor domain-containing protein n=1 Tax=Sporolactobacillus sp. THM19-2 TaxID=2511171 RepID=UPI001022766D|nr:anti-sigma factor domain-containing protein [Sporolactobacillus sp. THM19-2]RYL93545.1 hypothetical protein EWH91_03595 [Sporolactobacillus sp. THM19-2]
MNRSTQRFIDVRRAGRKLNNRGVLVSKQGRRAVILTNDGDFESVRLRRTATLSVGETVLSAHLAHSFHLGSYFLIPVLALGFSMFCFAPLSHSTFQPDRPVAAYVSFDVASDIEASVDPDMRIISVQALDGNAKAILPDPDAFRNMSFSAFTSHLFERLNARGQLTGQTLCLITTAFTNQITRSERDHFNRKLFEAYTAGTARTAIRSGSASKWQIASMAGRQNARQAGLSMGKYLLYLKANAFHRVLSLDQARQLSALRLEQLLSSSRPVWYPFIRELTGKFQNGENQAAKATFHYIKENSLFRNPFNSLEKKEPAEDLSGMRLGEPRSVALTHALRQRLEA